MLDDGLLNAEHVLITGEDEPVLTAEELVQTVTEHFCQLLEWLVRFSKHERNLSEGETNNKNKITHKAQTQVTVKRLVSNGEEQTVGVVRDSNFGVVTIGTTLYLCTKFNN